MSSTSDCSGPHHQGPVHLAKTPTLSTNSLDQPPHVIIDVLRTSSSHSGLRSKPVGKSGRNIYHVAPLDVPSRSRSERHVRHLEHPPSSKRCSAYSAMSLLESQAPNSAASVSAMADFVANSHSKSVARWRTELDHDREAFSSISTWCAVMLERVLIETRAAPRPNPLRTAVCCMLVDRLVALLGDAEPIARKLLNEIFGCIYVNWEEYITKNAASTSASGVTEGTLGGNNRYDQPTHHDGTKQKTTASALTHRQTFFELYAELKAGRVAIVGRPARVVNHAVDEWCRTLLTSVFHTWRGDTVLRKQRRRKVRLQAATISKWRASKSVKAHFSAWRTYVFERRHQCRVVYEESNRVKLVHRMGRRIKQLEAENEEVHRSFDKLLEEHMFVAGQLRRMQSLFKEFRSRIGATEGVAEKSVTQVAGAGETKQIFAASSVGGSSTEVVAFHQQLQNQQGVSPSDAKEDPDADERRAAYKANNGVLFGSFPSSNDGVHFSQHAPPLVSDGVDVANMPSDVSLEDVLQRPNRLEQLSQYLDLETQKQPGNEGQVGEQAELAKKKVSANPGSSPSAKAGTASLPGKVGQAKHAKVSLDMDTLDTSENLPPPPQTNYRDVLDWASLRTQLILAANQPVMKRCTNFTNDFKDSLRLGYLLVSLGAEKTLLDEMLVAPTLVERAARVLNVATCFFDSGESGEELFAGSTPILPLDIVKGKGAKISKLLFALYSKYKDAPLVLLTSALNPRLASALRAVNDGRVSIAPKSGSFAGDPKNPVSNPTRSSEEEVGDGLTKLSTSFMSSGSLEAENGEPEPLPDSQFMQWYRDLAASDSDAEEVAEFFEEHDRRKSALEEVAHRLSHSISMHMHRSDESAAPRSSVRKSRRARCSREQRQKRVATKDSSGAPDARPVARRCLLSWLHDTLSVANGGAAEDVELDRLNDIDLLEGVARALQPDAPQASSNDPKARLLVLQKVLQDRLHLRRIKLRTSATAAPAVKEGRVVSLKQLMTTLYVLNTDGVLGL